MTPALPSCLDASRDTARDTHAGGWRLLIVEDEAIVAEDLAEQLIGLGYDVCGIADNGEEAIKLANDHLPQLVLMDVVIKGDIDGIETAARMNRDHDLAIIFLTAYSDSETVRRATETAPYGFLTKPYQIKEIKAALDIAAYKYTLEQGLKESERWFSSMLRCTCDAIIAVDHSGEIIFANQAAAALFTLTQGEFAGRAFDQLVMFVPSDVARLTSPLQLDTQNVTNAFIRFGETLELPNGQRLPVDVSAAPIRDTKGESSATLISLRNVSERFAAEYALRQSEESFRTAFEMAPNGMALVSVNGQFLHANQALSRLLNLELDSLCQKTQADVTLAEDLAGEERQLLNLFIEGIPSVQFEKRYITAQGTATWALVSVSLIRQSDTALCYLYQVHDLTLRKEYELHLARQAMTDGLTGLPNRTALMTELERLIARSKRRDQKFAVLFVDLDYFKQVNDTYGHETGDQLLTAVASSLRTLVRASDFVARLSGDEFIILLTDLVNAEQVRPVVKKLLSQFSRPFSIGNRQLQCGLSIGISMYPDDHQEPEKLLQLADNALYQVKAEGRGASQFYRQEFTHHLNARMNLDDELEKAVNRQEFELFYQPIVPLDATHSIKAEALIRWRHPTRGLVGPFEFINQLEDSGMIVELGRWIIRTACQHATCWPRVHGQAPEVSVNISARQFRFDDLVGTISAALSDSGLPPEKLCIEITEKLLMIDSDATLATIDALKALGVKVAIDDFGIGYSSLSYIRRFQPDNLKIDREFVQGIDTSEYDQRLLAAIIAMGDQLHISITAEGVETGLQRNYLHEHHCGYIQGYFYSKPLAETEFRLWLEHTAPAVVASPYWQPT
ncbi:two-component system response regulator [Larsenimonas suaedae]|uniref:EAL domain-containing protein n=1 Tax=Larsenimonas suaedae TaxID=1851019 RepID=A0ABU1GWD9_9GAMM|nr:EAL domain-containing protein [Larsenimonas suaedae]MCM2972929.1 EAL domain-containing protein [Larsenimonas suaedae]MDR5896366.1 EAL domain-containing protein [Larsenimonas suaedae]